MGLRIGIKAFATALALLGPTPWTAQAQAVFTAVQSANLPTATLLPRGSWLFEIAHRFDTPISDGGETFWGLDGPAFNRLGLSWSVGDGLTVGILRTNADDNVEVNLKAGGWTGARGDRRIAMAVMGGVAWNTEIFETPSGGAEDNEVQAYAQAILDIAPTGRISVGLVPSFLHNPRIASAEAENTFAVGVTLQAELTRSLGVFTEWLAGTSRPGQEHDPLSVGFASQTRGHTFKLLVTNQTRPNPTQFLGGASRPFEPDEWRFGFNITRVLPF